MMSMARLNIAITILVFLAAAPAKAQETWNTLPGEFAIRTANGHYLTAINGGGRANSPVIVTSATRASDWEKFKIGVTAAAIAHDKAFQTASGNFVTAVDGGGRTSEVLHTDATQRLAWEEFRIHDLSAGGERPTYFAIQTVNDHYLTAVGAGGKYEDAIHSDATVARGWEQFRIVKCGDLGTNLLYTIVTNIEQPLSATRGSGNPDSGDITIGAAAGDTPDQSQSRFRFIKQPDGSYALQPANGATFVSALGGGGLVQKNLPPNCGFPGACIGGATTIFHTNAQLVQSWERFKIVDTGDCRYTIQTTSGFFVGIYKDSDNNILLTTRRVDITDNEKFQLVMYGLASPGTIH